MWEAKATVAARRRRRLENRSIVKLQAFGRMVAAQVRSSHIAVQKYVAYRVVPACRLLQRWARGCLVRSITTPLLRLRRARRTVGTFMLHARVIRLVRSRHERWLDTCRFVAATHFQRLWRGVRARARVADMLDSMFADAVLATRTLQRWWRRCAAAATWRDALDTWRVRNKRRVLEEARSELALLEADIAEVKLDIKFSKRGMRRDRRRKQELREHQAHASQRCRRLMGCCMRRRGCC